VPSPDRATCGRSCRERRRRERFYRSPIATFHEHRLLLPPTDPTN